MQYRQQASRRAAQGDKADQRTAIEAIGKPCACPFP